MLIEGRMQRVTFSSLVPSSSTPAWQLCLTLSAHRSLVLLRLSLLGRGLGAGVLAGACPSWVLLPTPSRKYPELLTPTIPFLKGVLGKNNFQPFAEFLILSLLPVGWDPTRQSLAGPFTWPWLGIWVGVGVGVGGEEARLT